MLDFYTQSELVQQALFYAFCRAAGALGQFVHHKPGATGAILKKLSLCAKPWKKLSSIDHSFATKKGDLHCSCNSFPVCFSRNFSPVLNINLIRSKVAVQERQ